MANWRCHSAKDLPLNTETAWDGSSASKAMLDAAGIGGDDPDVEQARRGFLLVDDSAKELRGSYSLPFADLLDGKLTCLITGCRAAASRLPQKDGVSDAERTKARGVLDAYFAKAEDDSARSGHGQRVYQFPMRVEMIPRATGTKEMKELLALAEERAVDASVFETHPPFFFRVTATTDRLDSYGTHQMPSSLANYAADLDAGLPFLANHNYYSLPMGQSLRGKYVRGAGERAGRTWGDFFAVPDLNLNGINTSDFITGVQAGVITDVSKTFWEGRWICDICGNDYNRYGSGEGRCPHFLLEEYDVEGRGMVTCTAGVEDAHMMELSAVFAGSVPGAAIEKAIRAIEAGEMPAEKARSLSIRYRAALPGTEHFWPGCASLPRPVSYGTSTVVLSPAAARSVAPANATLKETPMGDTDTRAPEGSAEWTLPAAERERYRTLVSECGLKPDAPPAAIVEALRSQIAAHATERDTAVAERDALQKQVEELEPRALDGDAHRTDLVNETWSEYVRAGKADGKDEILTKARWQKEPLDDLKERLKDYQEMAASRLPGGRLTGEGEQPTPKASPAPLHLYAV